MWIDALSYQNETEELFENTKEGLNVLKKNAEDYKSEVTSTDAATGTMDADRAVEYTNTRNGVVPTGIMLSIIPGAALIGVAGVGIALSKKSKKDEDDV